MTPPTLFLLAGLFAATSLQPQDGGGDGGFDHSSASRARVAATLAAFRLDESTADATVEELLALGPELLPALHAHLAGRPGPCLPDHADEELVLDSLAGRLGRSAVVTFVSDLAERPGTELDAANREAALFLLETVARAEDLALALELCTQPALGSTASTLRRPLHELALRVVERDAGAAVRVPAYVRRYGPESTTLLVRAVGRAAGEEGWSALSALLGSDDRLDRVTLDSIAALARRHPGTAPPFLGGLVTTYLQEDDASLVRSALPALAALDVQDAYESVFELLESDDSSIAHAAHAALQALTGLGLPATSVRWRQWHASELAWWRTEAPAVMAELAGGQLSETRAAVRALARHRLRRDVIAGQLIALLDWSPPILRQDACEALGLLGAKSAVPVLREIALSAESGANLRATAVRALQQLGVELDVPGEDALALSGARR